MEDRLPIEIIPYLRKEFPSLEFIEAESPDEIEDEKELNIIDTAEGLKEVSLITDLDSICESKRISLHDFDLAMTLKIMKKIGKIKKIRIIAIPKNYSKNKSGKEKAIKETIKMIREAIGIKK
ncbi:MAG: hypothetical protein NZ903_00500 [Candidatus Micrarchaeota archaeon]|nr:hypothetical protein [Candidatus Micrarchaeota archaeon]